MPSQIRHAAKRIRTTPASAPRTAVTPTCATADARTAPPNEYRASIPYNHIYSGCQARFWRAKRLSTSTRRRQWAKNTLFELDLMEPDCSCCCSVVSYNTTYKNRYWYAGILV